jgi:plasmid stabilization system protein ParE
MSQKKRLEWSIRSRNNVADIQDYLIGKNPVAAASILNEIRLLAGSLCDFPLIGHSGRRANTRELVLKNYPYTVIYRVTATKIIIAAVLHQRQKN